MTDIVEIEALGAQGDGLAEGGRLFVPGALPGERVRVLRRGGRAQVAEVLAPSPERVTPPCAHFGTCGGCALQHASDRFTAAWKRDLVARALAARGIEGVEIRETLTSPLGARRRVTLAGRRTKKGETVGFHEAGSDRIVPVTECPVADPRLAAVIPRLGELVRVLASRKGEIRIFLTATEAGVDAAVIASKPPDGPARALMAGIAARAGLARLAVDGEVLVTIRPPTVPIGRAEVLPPPGAFLQATAHGEAALVAAVREAVTGPHGPPRRAVDLFAGVGTFALPLAEGAADVRAVEAEAEALAALDSAWRGAEGLGRIVTERRNLFHRPLLPAELGGFDAAVIDPPRAGAREQAVRLAESAVPRIASVSCNPATFARDARILLDGGYRLDWVQPIDQFRHAAHVELVAAFVRGG
jgi:23S rRNA (uracil1939-C5)-methyltransferase